MVHSIELLLNAEAEEDVRQLWQRLAEAGLPSEHRPDETAGTPRRPHLTLVACSEISEQQANAAGRLAAEALPLPVVVGAPMIFGSARAKRPSLILVRQLLGTVELLELQQRVLQVCPPPVDRNFTDGHWAPHVTLARRLAPEQVGAALQVLARAAKGSRPETEARLTGCRCWRGDLKQARLLHPAAGW